MRVFISNVDSAIGYSLSLLFSKKHIEHQKTEEEEAQEKVQEPYVVVGTMLKNPPEIISKPGDMHYTGKKDKDDLRKERITKFSVPGTKPKWVNSIVDVLFIR